MAKLHGIGSGKPGSDRRRGHPISREAQLLLDVPAAYGGRGAWLDRRSWPQLQLLLERCREDLALYHGTTPGKAAARLLARIDPPGGGRRRCFLAGLFDWNGELCAVVDVTRREPDDGDWWLGLILVRPDLRGRGIGADVVQALEQWVRAEGGRAIFVAVQRRNLPALHFARRTGFVLEGETSSAPSGPGKVDLLVRWVA